MIATRGYLLLINKHTIVVKFAKNTVGANIVKYIAKIYKL